MAQSLPAEVVVRYSVRGFSERWLLPEGNVPEAPWHFACASSVHERIARRFHASNRDAAAFRNLAIRVREDMPQVGFDPDVCVVEPAPADAQGMDSLKLWRPGHRVPRLVIEVVSKSHPSKDYVEVPDQCAAVGVEELVVFDPKRLGPRGHGGRKLMRVWRRTADGSFDAVFSGDEPVHSVVLDAWLIPSALTCELLIADEHDGGRPWPTNTDAEQAALARVAALEAELAKR